MRAVITGAASGIGRAVALRLAQDCAAQAKLLVVDIAADKLESVAAELRTLQAEVQVFAGDLADPVVPARIIEHAARSLGGLDALISNAGVLGKGPLAELTLEDFDRTFAINTRAAWLLAKAAYPLLKASRGCIVATASLAAGDPTPRAGTYSASKAALVMLVRQLANEWGPEGIRCNTVSPGATLTGMTTTTDPAGIAERESKIPLRRIAPPEEIAAVVAFLVSRDAGYVTGTDLKIDGGMTTTLMDGHRRPRPAGPR